MKNLLFIVLFALICGFVFILEDFRAVYAQEQTTEEFTLDEITVTAQMREENQQKVPIMIETISGEDLNMMGRITLEDTLAGISSAIVQKAGKELSVIIRGMDNDAIAGDSFSQVAVTLDGVFSNSFGVGYSGIYDMERVEILSGPQGTLYSRNASGGVVNMVSNNPSTDRYVASGSLELGNYSLINTKGMVNIPLSDKFALRTAFNIVRRDGFVSNGTNDNRVNSARLKFAYYPLEAMSAVLSYEYTHTGGRGQGGGVDAFEDEDDVDDPWYSSQPEDVASTDRD
ncbi:MAG: TonB-dependent receptor, partial [Deltaproteobacteria bacterium]|nr:TonB-dependent receptor [Deltaproteobacteria bacterium]